jgi:hypothetical protein
MPLASDGKGNFLTLGQDGQWAPATRARNPETGSELILDGAEWKPLPGTEPTTLGSAARGVVRGATLGFADELRAGTDAAVQGARNLFGGDGPGMGETYDRSLASSREQDRRDHDTNPVASTVGELVGGAGSAIGGGAVLAPLRAGQALAAINPLARAAVGGAAVGGATGFGTAEGGLVNRLGEGAVGAGVGAGVGAAASAVGIGVGRMISPIRPNLSPEAERIRNVAQAEGIPLSIGQQTGSRTMKNIEGALAQLPGSSAMEANAQRIQSEAFTRGALRRSGDNADVATPAVLNASAARSGGEIGRIANSYDLDASPPGFLNNLVASADKARGFAASDVERQTLARIDDIVGKVQVGDVIPGQAYRELRSDIGETMRSTQDGDLRRHLRGVMNTLDDAFANSIPPAEKAAFDQARRQYANLHVIADAMGGAGEQTAVGNLSPLRLQGAVERSTGGGYAWGQGDLNDYARIGQAVLRAPPDSGTAGRGFAMNALSGGMSLGGAGAGFGVGGPVGMIAGAAAPFVIPSVVQSFLNSRAGRAYLTNQLASGLEVGGRAGGTLGGAVERNRLLND